MEKREEQAEPGKDLIVLRDEGVQFVQERVRLEWRVKRLEEKIESAPDDERHGLQALLEQKYEELREVEGQLLTLKEAMRKIELGW